MVSFLINYNHRNMYNTRARLHKYNLILPPVLNVFSNIIYSNCLKTEIVRLGRVVGGQ